MEKDKRVTQVNSQSTHDVKEKGLEISHKYPIKKKGKGAGGRAQDGATGLKKKPERWKIH